MATEVFVMPLTSTLLHWRSQRRCRQTDGFKKNVRCTSSRENFIQTDVIRNYWMVQPSETALPSDPLNHAAVPTTWIPNMREQQSDQSKSPSESSLRGGNSSSSGIGRAVRDRIAASPLALICSTTVGDGVNGVAVTEVGKSVLDDAAELRVVVRGARLRIAGDAGVDAAAAAAVALRSVLAFVSITSSNFPQSTQRFLNFHWLEPLLVTFLCSHSDAEVGVTDGSAVGAAALAFAFAFASVWRLLLFS